MLDAIVNDVGLLNAADSKTKYIRIDGSTQPMDRQNQIKAFQNDPSIRIAVLGITAAGVAVTLTASSTVWFTELFWTPALMIQAEGKFDVVALLTQASFYSFLTLWMFSFLRSLSPNWAKLSSTVPLFRCSRNAGRAFVENARREVPGSWGIRRRKRETKADSTSSLHRY
jgi:hypothetical protein